MSEYKSNSEKVQKLGAMNPEEMSNQLVNSTPGLQQAAPELTPHLYAIASRATQFLHSKLPRPSSELVGDDEYEPSESQKERFDHYHAIVHDPVSVLHHVKEGTLSQSHMEALQAVYPGLLQNMQAEVAGHLTPKSVKNLPYGTKMSLSKFVGQPVESSLIPRVALANQIAYSQMPGNQPQQTQQKAKGGSKNGDGKLGLSQRSETRTQGLEEQDD